MVSLRLSPLDLQDIDDAVQSVPAWVADDPNVHKGYLVLNSNLNICMTLSLRGARERDALLLGIVSYARRKGSYTFEPTCIETRSNTQLSRAIQAAMERINTKERKNGSSDPAG